MDSLNNFMNSLDADAKKFPMSRALDLFFSQMKSSSLSYLFENESKIRSWLTQRQWKGELHKLNLADFSKEFLHDQVSFPGSQKLERHLHQLGRELMAIA